MLRLRLFEDGKVNMILNSDNVEAVVPQEDGGTCFITVSGQVYYTSEEFTEVEKRMGRCLK